jgi:hypothetical protein
MSKDEEGYNGKTNYETWAVALWIDNDQQTYGWAREITRDIIKSADPEDKDYTIHADVANALKDWFEEQNPLSDTATVFTDLLGAALSEIDWYEIAGNYIEEVKNENIS